MGPAPSLVPERFLPCPHSRPGQQEPLRPWFRMKKLRFGEAKSPIQGHTARRWAFELGLNQFLVNRHRTFFWNFVYPFSMSAASQYFMFIRLKN